MFPAGLRPSLRFFVRASYKQNRGLSFAKDLTNILPPILCQPIVWSRVRVISPLAPDLIGTYECPKTKQRFTLLEDEDEYQVRSKYGVLCKIPKKDLPKDWTLPDLDFILRRPPSP